MKSFLTLLLITSVLVIITVSGLWLLTYRIYDTEEINQTNLNGFVEQRQSVDYLFIGSSLCYSSINNPYFDSVTGKSSYNLGYAGAGPVFIESILNKSSLVKSKQIFWVVSPNDLIDITDNINAYPYFLFNEYNEFKYYMQGISKFHDLVTIFQLRLWSFCRGKYGTHVKPRGIKGEFTSFQNNPSADSADVFSTISVKEVNHKKGELLYNIVLSNPKMGIVIYPYFKFAKAYKPEVIHEFQSLIVRFLKAGVKVIDINREADKLFQPADWRNFDHLNTKGANKMSKMIAEMSLFKNN